jgi:hypothetical protein
VITLSDDIDDITEKRISDAVTGNARLLCLEGLKTEFPAGDLNNRFLLYGYFRF